MLIKSLKLVGNKRLRLNIHTFIIRPKAMVQLILGTNGSGKSSVINELTPLPADKNDYSKDGCKVIEIVKLGSEYVLSSTFTPSTKHSFVKDGEELNTGGTERVQRDLVKEHFGITPAIHELMRGGEKFTLMASAKRREWFTELAVADYDFAMVAYEKIRKRHRDVSGALDRNSAHLVVETAKIISKDEEERLDAEVKVLLDELEILMAERMPLEHPVENYTNRRDHAMAELEEISLRLLANKIIAPLAYNDGRVERDEWGELRRTSFQSVEELEAAINDLKHKVTSVETIIQQSTEQFNQQSHNYDVLMKAGQDGVQNLVKQHHALDLERMALLARRKLELEIADPVMAQKAFEPILSGLQSLLSELPSNEDRRFGRERLATLKETIFRLEEQQNHGRIEISKLQAQIEHADKHRTTGKVTCPECDHTWVAGIREDEYARAKEKLSRLSDSHLLVLKQLERGRESIKEVEVYFSQYREFMSMVRNFPVLEVFWNHLLESNTVTDAPKEAVNLTQVFQRDLEYAAQAQQLLMKMDEISKLRIAAEQVGDASIQDVKDEMERLTKKLGMLTAQLTQLQLSIAAYNDYRRQLVAGQNMADRVNALFSQAHELQAGYIEALRRESIIHCITQVQQSLVLRQESLRHAKVQKAVVQKLEEQVADLFVEEQATKAMVNALSPSHGLIAEGLLGFIRCFVGQMNTFIKKIWTYPLQVIPTGYNNENGEQSTELDYKFKMIVGDENNVVPEVKEASDGQAEIVNLAFKVVAIHYLRLSDSPLFLDEFGRALDDAHRSAATHAIKSLMDNYNHTQLFLVSHYQSSYGSFTNADICVMDKRNIALSDNMRYNDHVTIA